MIKNEDSFRDFYLNSGEETVYFVEVPKELKLNIDYDGNIHSSYFMEAKLYLFGFNGNTLLTEMFRRSTSGRLEMNGELLYKE